MVQQDLRNRLASGLAIPASPLALNSSRKLDERRQRALWKYYEAAGAGGIAIGVHTTQFAIRNPEIALFRPLLQLANEELDRLDSRRDAAFTRHMVRIAGVCGETTQAVAEAELAVAHKFDAGLLSLGDLKRASDDILVGHCHTVAETIPIIGFYLQPAVGGRVLSYGFWRRFLEIESVVAIKIAPFNRYQTIDVVRAVIDSGRYDVALYTGNDDNIVLDLLTPFRFTRDAPLSVEVLERRIVGGLLGHWSVWTQRAVELLQRCQGYSRYEQPIDHEMLRLAIEVTDANAALFDAANLYSGCIAGLHEVLRRQGLLEGIWCLDPSEGLNVGQMEEIDRVYAAYPHLNDDSFVECNRDEWLKG